ncbi:pentapeptide repeat-containing protein [Nocardia sp. NBC_01327]|uniref:pentapeptide repeat-containing protein n=1 Tax=Nocardia sp. NBC_01327 TaxID=2903593 RepID=UPI002E1295E9|nr:pentapeptide repeat-containing protein [Nocardia sp. NBC_01327]
MPRELADLSFARHLVEHDEIGMEGEYDCALFEGLQLDEVQARGAQFTECAITAGTVSGGTMRHARFNDVWIHGTQWIRTDLSDSSWLDTELVMNAFSGVEAFGARLRRVRFYNCKFDSVNLRGAHLNDVSFVDCVLRHIDISEAKLTAVSFPGSEVQALSMRKAELKKVDLRSARYLNVSDGVEALAGATITSTQLLDLAPTFAAAIGIVVKD